MSSWFHSSAVDFGSGLFALIVFGAGAASAIMVVLIVAVLRRAGRTELTNAFWGAGLVLIGVAGGALLLDRSGSESRGGRRTIEGQAAELNARAMAHGSALACLDAVPNAVTDACAKSLFATPEAVAVALDYIDAKFQLLAASAPLAERDPALRPGVERLRSAIEADPFGLVAHVLTTRGCNGSDCGDIKLLRDPARILANMKAHTLESHIGIHAVAWSGGLAPTAMALPPANGSMSSPAAPGAGPTIPALPSTSGTSGNGKFDFPSAASIPAVSIMSAEPGAPPPKTETNAPPVPPKRPPQPRRQSARGPASPPPGPAAPPPASHPALTAAPVPQAQSAPEAAPDPAPDPRATGVY